LANKQQTHHDDTEHRAEERATPAHRHLHLRAAGYDTRPGGFPTEANAINQSINQSNILTEPHTGKEKPIPALPPERHASRSGIHRPKPSNAATQRHRESTAAAHGHTY